jgi:hypothetical protein
MFKKPLAMDHNHKHRSDILKKAEQGIIDWLPWLYNFSLLHQAFSL